MSARLRRARGGLAAVLVLTLAAGFLVAARAADHVERIWVTAYFENSNGLFAGDDVRILGVPVGRVDSIRPEPTRAR
ncbi:MlaD family protein, partial [Mycolicibacterium sp.]